MALRANDWTGHHMQPDREFQQLEEWFTPKRIKRILQEWHARYEPWAYHHPDEQGIRPLLRTHNVHDAPEIRQTEVAGSVQWALNRLAMYDPVLYDVIIGLYLDVEPKRDKDRPHVINWEPRMSVFELAEWQGCHARTVYKREEKARELMAGWLGWKQRRERE